MAYTPNLIRGQNKVNADKMIDRTILKDYERKGKPERKYRLTKTDTLPLLFGFIIPFFDEQMTQKDKCALVRDLWEVCGWVNDFIKRDPLELGDEGFDIEEYAFSFRNHLFNERGMGLEDWYSRINGDRVITVEEVVNGEFARNKLIRKLNRHKRV